MNRRNAACVPRGSSSDHGIASAKNRRAIALKTVYLLARTESGDEISGLACSYEATLAHILFTDVPVTGGPSYIRFTPPGRATIFGEFEEERDQIGGNFGGRPSDLRFIRTENGRCEPAR
jgi:hypothetical protein